MSVRVSDEEIVEFIIEFQYSHGYPPTLREIGAHCGYTSLSTVANRLRGMTEKGLIETIPFKPRTIKVVTK